MNGKSSLHVMRETMNGQRYADVLRQYVPEISNALGNPGTDWFFMEDNATPHTCQVANAAKQELGLRRINWPSKSPDLNPIEHVWSWMKRNLRRQLKPEDTLQLLEEKVSRVWDEVPVQIINQLVSSMTARVAATIQNKGGSTHY